MIILWIICLIILGIATNFVQKEITEQKKNDMEKRTESTNR